MSFSMYLEVDEQGMAKIEQVIGKPPAGKYRLNGHIYGGPGEAPDSINVQTPYGFVSTSAFSGRNVPVVKPE